MSAAPSYIIDANVFITAKNSYYAFDICPGFWDSLIAGYEQGKLHSIDRVRHELMNGRPEEDLVQWVQHDLPNDFFFNTTDPEVTEAFGEVMLWVQQSAQYYDSAKADFATKADGWLVAYAMVHDTTIATNELANPDIKREVKLGNACGHFDVAYEDPFAMLRRLRARFEYGG